jgi:flagellar hook-associated protein 1 FlgK
MSKMGYIGYSGMRAAQVAMNATSQNIANINTPGFSRLTTILGSLGGNGGISVGGGVSVLDVRRISDNFSNQQLWRATSDMHRYGSGQDYLGPLEDIMGSTGSSVSIGLDDFYSALGEASDKPQSITARQQIINEMKNLAQRFNGQNNHVNAELSTLREERATMGKEINGLAGHLADLNKKIVASEAVGADTSALRDHRETLVADLSKYANVRVDEQDDGSLTVSLANGQPLVIGDTAGALEITRNTTGGQEISLVFAGATFGMRQDSLGGALGGLYEVEKNQLLPTREALREMASALTVMMNDTMGTGFDLNGDPGQDWLEYDPATGVLTVKDLKPEELAFSSSPTEEGNNEVLLDLIALKDQAVLIGGSTLSLNEAYARLLVGVASASRQNQANLKTATEVTVQSQSRRDSISAVSMDEEAYNLMDYNKAYQANMKVIETANQMFQSILTAF